MAVHLQINADRCRGFTLTELLIVVVIIGMLGAVAAPTLRSGDPEKLELAATQVAAAIRFARSEAIRTGSVHAAIVSPATERVRVEKTDVTVEPVVTESILYHPINRNLYDFFVHEAPTVGVQIANAENVFDYTGGVLNTQRVMFDAQGMPVFIKPLSGTTHRLTDGQIQLQIDNHVRTVTVQPYTGRVTIQ